MRNSTFLTALSFLITFCMQFAYAEEEINLLKNPDFESRTSAWSKTGSSTFTIESASPLDGTYSASWDASASGEYFRSSSYTIPSGLKGTRCMMKMKYLWDSGTSGHILMNVDDGANNVASLSLNPTSGSVSQYAYLPFTCPSSGTIRFELESTANAASIMVDKMLLGRASITSEKPQDVFSAKISSTDVVSDENKDWITGNCTDATAGKSTCVIPSGIFSTTPNCTAVAVSNTRNAKYDYLNSTATSLVFFGTDTTGSATNSDITVSCQNIGSAANREALTLDTTGISWSGYHDNTCSWARSNVAYGDPTADASCSLVERVNSGFGTVSASGSVLPAITFTPKYIGKYWVCAIAEGQVNNVNGSFKLWDGTTTISERAFSFSTGSYDQVPLCGIYNVTSISSVTLSIQVKSAAAGAVTIATAIASSAIEWSIYPISQQMPAPVFTELQNLNKNSSSGTTTEVALLNCDASSAITSQIGSWVSSIGNISAGTCSVTLTSGVFGATPYCTVIGNADDKIMKYSGSSATSISFGCVNGAGANCTTIDAYLSCTGVRP